MTDARVTISGPEAELPAGAVPRLRLDQRLHRRAPDLRRRRAFGREVPPAGDRALRGAAGSLDGRLPHRHIHLPHSQRERGGSRRASGPARSRSEDVEVSGEDSDRFLALQDVRLTDVSLLSSEAVGELMLVNPLGFDVKIAEATYVLLAEGEPVGEGSARGLILRGAQRKNTLRLPIAIDHASLLSAAGQALAGRRRRRGPAEGEARPAPEGRRRRGAARPFRAPDGRIVSGGPLPEPPHRARRRRSAGHARPPGRPQRLRRRSHRGADAGVRGGPGRFRRPRRRARGRGADVLRRRRRELDAQGRRLFEGRERGGRRADGADAARDRLLPEAGDRARARSRDRRRRGPRRRRRHRDRGRGHRLLARRGPARNPAGGRLAVRPAGDRTAGGAGPLSDGRPFRRARGASDRTRPPGRARPRISGPPASANGFAPGRGTGGGDASRRP